MSRFFTAGSSSESESEEEEIQEEGFHIPSRFAKGDSDSEEEKRVVKSRKDKRHEELQQTVQKINNAIKINDWNQISSEFDKLNKQITNPKVKAIIQKDGKGLPRFYIKTLADLEDFSKKVHENKKDYKMNAANQRSFNAMRQKLKKHNKSYETEIEAFRKSGGEESEEESEGEESEDEDEDEAPKAAGNKWMKSKDTEESDDDIEFGDSDEEDEGEWTVASDKKKKPAAGKKKLDKTPAKPIEMSPEEIRKVLKEVLSQRGKRNTDPVKQEEKLKDLLTYSKTADLTVEILLHLVSIQFDMNRSASTYLPVNTWKTILDNLNKILSLLEQNPQIILEEERETESDLTSDVEEEEEQKLVSGNLLAFIQRLDDEFMKSLQAIDPHTQDYVQRLQDENAFLELTEKSQLYYERLGNKSTAAKVAIRRVEHIYYKLDTHTSDDNKEEDKTSGIDNKDLLENLAKLIYAHGDQRMSTRMILCHIYYHALHDRFYQVTLSHLLNPKARDMMLMSHLQESISHMDISTQILFNRTTVQLGLCAFRNNMIKQAHSCLSEIYSGGRVKELLAQGVTPARHTDKTIEQGKIERKRQLPFHMHIPLDLLEAVHLITAMLLEVPNMAANAFDPKQKVISRFFRRQLDTYDRQVFNGPPENNREIVTVAAKALGKGDWKRCEELILGLPVWNLMNKSDQVKAIVRRKVQEEGLRTYLFTYSSFYDSMSLEHLSAMFELPKNTVHSIVSKMMISDELHASWDQPSGAIVLHKVEASRLQFLAMQFADKASTFVENNERLLDTRFGYAPKYDSKPQKGTWQDSRNVGKGKKTVKTSGTRPRNY